MNIDLTAPNKNGFINIISLNNGRWDSENPDSLASLVKYVFDKRKAGVITEDQVKSVVFCPEPLKTGEPVLYQFKTKTVKTKTGKFFPRNYILVKNAGSSSAGRNLL